MNSFGQEFYPYESLRALRTAAKTRTGERAVLLETIAHTLPQPGARTRRRIAGKILQRYVTGNRRWIDPPPHQQPFVRLITRRGHAPSQIELLYWELSRTDTLVGVLARELFYPVGIERRPPKGMDEAEFAVANGALLPEIGPTAPPLTRAFIAHYAGRQWDFDDTSSLDRALRVLHGAGLIVHERMNALRGHPSAFRVSEHEVALVTFVYALYSEYLPHFQRPDFSLCCLDVERADFARTLLLSPEQVRGKVAAARAHHLLAGHEDEVRLTFGNLNVLVDALLAKAI